MREQRGCAIAEVVYVLKWGWKMSRYANKVWWEEVEEMLRDGWNSNLEWEAIIELCGRMQKKLEEVRRQKGIKNPTFWCPVCKMMEESEPRVTVNAILYRTAKLGLEEMEEVKKRSYRWQYYKRKHGLDGQGKVKSHEGLLGKKR